MSHYFFFLQGPQCLLHPFFFISKHLLFVYSYCRTLPFGENWGYSTLGSKYYYSSVFHQSCPTLCRIIACQAPQSMEFPTQEYWSGVPFPPPGDLPDQGSNLCLCFLHWQADSLLLSHLLFLDLSPPAKFLQIFPPLSNLQHLLNSAATYTLVVSSLILPMIFKSVSPHFTCTLGYSHILPFPPVSRTYSL